ncbi:hypothetical protein ACFC0C_38950 [Streptomyces sp. NPDC056178]|uniref:hypothetical protein n=1 Tax=unclassified Streptomyces TaxID=2593676 RepID=UPI0035D57CC4
MTGQTMRGWMEASGRRMKLRPVEEWRDVYDWLDAVRKRPGVWVRDGSLKELALMMFGYHLALQVHDADETFEFHPTSGGFASWLNWTRGLSMAAGWDGAIAENSPGEPSRDAFFRLLDEFRRSSTPAGVAESGRPAGS